MQQLKYAIEQMLKEAGLDKAVAQHSAVWIWDEIVGETIAKNARPEGVRHRVLTVKVETPPWRQELIFRKYDIIKKLNKKLGIDTIKDIRFL